MGRSQALAQHYPPELFRRHLFRTPAVRHLAWLVNATPLLHVAPGGNAPINRPGDLNARLQALDEQPQALLEHLAERGSRRLGLYFEQLYGYAMAAFLGQRILAQNLALRVAGRTLGELDFLLQDLATGQVSHHEIAVKFYMGWQGVDPAANPTAKAPGWYGPDTRDNLDAKLQRLREHQLPMWQGESGRACLRERGLPSPDASVLALYGYLFQPMEGVGPRLPDVIGGRFGNHRWVDAEKNRQHLEENTYQVIIRKPDWLGPVQYPADFQPESIQQGPLAGQLQHALNRSAVLVANIERTEEGFWLETGRRFLTPPGWCLDG